MTFEQLDFYREHAKRYSELSHEFTQSVYTDCSHPALRSDLDLLRRVAELAPGTRGLDAGCGAGARDVHLLHTWGFDVYGIDAVDENIRLGKELHPEVADRLQLADLRGPLPYENASFDFVMCNAVIQHLPTKTTETTTLPELTRGLCPSGVLQLMFKMGSGVVTVGDRAFGKDSVDRTFQLYDEYRLLEVLEDCGCTLVQSTGSDELGGLLYFNDPKPMRYCVFWVKKG